MITDALSVLRAEVQVDPTGRPNLMPNPSGEGGAWFWVTPLRFTKITTVAGALRFSTATGVGDAYAQSNPIRVAAGDYIGARFDTVGGTAGHVIKLRWRWFNLAGDLLSESTQTSAFDTTAGTHYKSAVQAPAGTSFAKLKIDLYSGTSSPPAPNAHYDFQNVMVTTDAATFANTYPFEDPVSYTNVLGPTNNISISRGAMEPGVIGVRIIDTTLDPAEVDALRTGRLFRVTALNDATAAFEDLAAGLYINRAEVAYDLSKPPEKQVQISLTLTDSLQLLANSHRANSVAEIDELPFVLETVGIPFNVNGQTGTLIDHPTITARLPDASALDQVLLTRDSNQGYTWINKSGVFNGWTDRGTDFYGGAATFAESDYSNLDVSFDSDTCINEVLVIRVVENPFTGETVEKTYGPYRDEASVDKWKVVRQATFRVTGVAEVDVPAFAADVLAASSEPVRRVNAITVPIRTPADITTAKALIDLYATARIVNTAKGIDLNQHVTTISHSIQCTAKGVRWVMTLGFDVAESVSSPAPAGGASGSARPATPETGSSRDRRYNVGASETSYDEFAGPTIGESWVRVDSTGGAARVAWSIVEDQLIATNSGGDTGNAVNALLLPLSVAGGSMAAGDAFITCVAIESNVANYAFGGLMFANGTTFGAGAQLLATSHVGTTSNEHTSRAYTNFNTQGAVSAVTITGSPAGKPYFTRLAFLGGSSWRRDFSEDGIRWRKGTAMTMTGFAPTHVGVLSSTFGTATPHVLSYEFLRRVSGVT